MAAIRNHNHLELIDEKYVVFADPQRRFLDCSDGVCELLGFSRAEMLGKTIEQISYDTAEVAPRFDSYLKQGLQEGDFILSNRNGAPILVKYRSWVFSDGCLAAAWQPAEAWEQRYVEALLELRLDQLKVKIAIALKAIQQRQAALTANDGLEIHQKLRDAISNLRCL